MSSFTFDRRVRGVGRPSLIAPSYPCDGYGLIVTETACLTGLLDDIDRPILDRFADDLAIAPELTGELTALCVEQHTRLSVALVSQALAAHPSAAEDIAAAAQRRSEYGLDHLAGILRDALDLAGARHA